MPEGTTATPQPDLLKNIQDKYGVGKSETFSTPGPEQLGRKGGLQIITPGHIEVQGAYNYPITIVGDYDLLAGVIRVDKDGDKKADYNVPIDSPKTYTVVMDPQASVGLDQYGVSDAGAEVEVHGYIYKRNPDGSVCEGNVAKHDFANGEFNCYRRFKPTETPTPTATGTTPPKETNTPTPTATNTETPTPTTTPVSTETPTPTATGTTPPKETNTPTPTATIELVTPVPTEGPDRRYPSYDLFGEGACMGVNTDGSADAQIDLGMLSRPIPARRATDSEVPAIEHVDQVKLRIFADQFTQPPTDLSGTLELGNTTPQVDERTGRKFWDYNIKGGLDNSLNQPEEIKTVAFHLDKWHDFDALLYKEAAYDEQGNVVSSGEVNDKEGNFIQVGGECTISVKVTPRALGGQESTSQSKSPDLVDALKVMGGVVVAGKVAEFLHRRGRAIQAKRNHK